MNEIPTGALLGVLLVLIALSGFFSGSETGLMTLNRYRLRHRAREGHRAARRTQALLERPDRLIGLILLGNNFINILASSIATLIAIRVWGEAGITLAAMILTFVILIFAEVAPKTMAALHPERLAFPAAWVYTPLLRILYPVVWVINSLANGLLRLIGVVMLADSGQSLSREELRTVVNESGTRLPPRHRQMLVGVLDLEQVTVEDIMIPRNEMVGIDLDEPWEDILEQLVNSPYTRLPAYHGTIDHLAGFVHLRRLIPLLSRDELTRERLEQNLQDPYYIPENTPLNKQLLNFQKSRRRIGVLVDEYGDIRGLVTLEDILEEIVGEFTTDPAAYNKHIHPEQDGSYLVDGSAHVREVNRALHLDLPTDGPRTLNGLILEYLEMIPEPGTSLLIAGYPIEIIQTKDNAVRKTRIQPGMRRHASISFPR